MPNNPRSPFGTGVTFGKDNRGNASIVVPKGTPYEQLPPELRAIIDPEWPRLPESGKTKFPRQCFAISDEIYKAVSLEEVRATFADMEELGIAKPPYPEFDVLTKSRNVFRPADGAPWKIEDERFQHSDVIFRFNGPKLIDALFDWNLGKGPLSLLDRHLLEGINRAEFGRFIHNIMDHSEGMYKLILVLLATRNVEKATATNKLAKMGIGKNKDRHWYTTTLKIGRVTETVYEKGEAHGGTVRPHLRRGHKRNQRWGPGFQFTRVIFIEPMFINADENFVSARTAYNVSKGI